MEIIKIDETEDTPGVILDAENNIFEFTGKSLPEEVTSFYNPIIDWMDGYSLSPNAKTNFIFKLEYFNTASSKLILDILLKLEDMQENGNEVLVTWYYQEADEDMQEAGEEFADMIEVPFEQISY